VYDAMDLAAGFHADAPQLAAETQEMERRLCERASVVLATTDVIAEHLRQLAGASPIVVRNAINARAVGMASDPEPAADVVRMLYVGTISHWFDFSLCREVLDRVPDATLTLAGPAEVEIPKMERLTHLGVVPHAELARLASDYTLLLMPFVRSPLVEAVDPVKLYEYISWRRPVISVDYPELEHFGRMINRYRDVDDFVALVEASRTNPQQLLPSREAASSFLELNTWQVRIEAVLPLLGQAPTESV
jgi:hypothetical protein